MFSFLANNIGTVVVSVILICIVCAVIIKMVKDRKNGKSSCGCGCSNCAMKDSCHGK